MYKYVLLTACLKAFLLNFKAVAGGNETVEVSSINEVNSDSIHLVSQTEELPQRSSEGVSNDQEVSHLSEEDRYDPEVEDNRRQFVMQSLQYQQSPWAENPNAYRRHISPLPLLASTLKSVTRLKSSVRRRLERIARRTAGKKKMRKHQERLVLRNGTDALDDTITVETTTTTTTTTTTERTTTKKKGERLDSKTKINENEPEVTTTLPKEVSYINVHTIYNDLLNITEEFPNVNITLEILDKTLGYNDIVLMKIKEMDKEDSNRSVKFRAKEYSDEEPVKSTIFIVHGLSVEGFSKLPCLILYSDFKQLLSYYFKHLDKFDIFIIPFANPDGVVATYTKFYWNKNMSPQKACPGVALDRNFDVAWTDNRSISTCDQNYPGPYPFSEVESIVVRDVLHKYSHKISAYLHVHSSGVGVMRGDGVLFPRGYTRDEGENEKYNSLRVTLEETFKNASFKVYYMNVESLYNWYGRISGSSVDYAASVYGVPFAAELVMHIYDDDTYEGRRESTQSAALREVWGRAIDQIFISIYGPNKRKPGLAEKADEVDDIAEATL